MRPQTILKSTVPALAKVRLGLRPAASHPPAIAEARASEFPTEDGVLEDCTATQLARTQAANEEEAARRAREEEALAEATQRGYQDGFAQGHAEGKEMGLHALTDRLGLLDRLLASVEAERAAAWDRCEDEACDLAFEAVCRILGENALDADAVAGVVRQVLRPVRELQVLRVRMHPADLEVLQHALQESAGDDLLRSMRPLLQADATMESGGCIVETSRGLFDGGFDVQLRRLKLALEALRVRGERDEHVERPSIA
jgi:flagellar assembly protein FliH